MNHLFTAMIVASLLVGCNGGKEKKAEPFAKGEFK